MLKEIKIRIEEAELAKLDAEATNAGTNRSAYIRERLLDRLITANYHHTVTSALQMPSVKQAPVIKRLHYLMQECAAVAAAVRDNAMDDGEPLDPAELIDLISDYQVVLDLLDEAFNVEPAQQNGACSIG